MAADAATGGVAQTGGVGVVVERCLLVNKAPGRMLLAVVGDLAFLREAQLQARQMAPV